MSGGLGAESGVIKVMIDGASVAYRTTSGNWLGVELIPLGSIAQIEIIRGPASALYGADAFLGVVNIITIKPEQIPLGLQEARTRLGRLPDARELAISVRSVSGPPGRILTWHELDIGLDALASGSPVNYRGISGAIDFNHDGDVAQGLVRFWRHRQRSNRSRVASGIGPVPPRGPSK